MSALRFLRRHGREDPAPAEDPVVRQYRFLLRTAPLDALEASHAQALARLDPMVRAALLRTAQEQLGAGFGLDLEDTEQTARLVAQGERRSPGALISAYEPAILQRLAKCVISSAAVADVLEGYDEWDGAEPQVAPGGEGTATGNRSAPAEAQRPRAAGTGEPQASQLGRPGEPRTPRAEPTRASAPGTDPDTDRRSPQLPPARLENPGSAPLAAAGRSRGGRHRASSGR